MAPATRQPRYSIPKVLYATCLLSCARFLLMTTTVTTSTATLSASAFIPMAFATTTGENSVCRNIAAAESKINAPVSNSRESFQPPPPSPWNAKTANIRDKDDDDIPSRYIRAEKGNIEAARSRYHSTLLWRAKHKIDNILTEPIPHFPLIKQNYLHYHHLRGHNGEPCYYELPAKTNLAALREGGLTIDDLLRYYALVCEFTWEVLAESDEDATSIYIMDLVGIRPWDFAGEVVDFVRKASLFTRDHYPERLGALFVVNVPSWFGVIWKVVRPMMDDVTRSKIFIFSKGDKKALLKALETKIPRSNIPPDYGGDSMPLGESPEEKIFAGLMENNNAISPGDWSGSA